MSIIGWKSAKYAKTSPRCPLFRNWENSLVESLMTVHFQEFHQRHNWEVPPEPTEELLNPINVTFSLVESLLNCTGSQRENQTTKPGTALSYKITSLNQTLVNNGTLNTHKPVGSKAHQRRFNCGSTMDWMKERTNQLLLPFISE